MLGYPCPAQRCLDLGRTLTVARAMLCPPSMGSWDGIYQTSRNFTRQLIGESRYRITDPFEKRDREAQEPPRFACPGCGDEVMPSATCARCNLIPLDHTGRTVRHVVPNVRARESAGADLIARTRDDGVVVRATITSISDEVGGAAASVEPVFEHAPFWARWLRIRRPRIEACGTFLVRDSVGLLQVSAATAVYSSHVKMAVGVGDEVTLIGHIETSDDPYRGTVRRFLGAIRLD